MAVNWLAFLSIFYEFLKSIIVVLSKDEIKLIENHAEDEN